MEATQEMELDRIEERALGALRADGASLKTVLAALLDAASVEEVKQARVAPVVPMTDTLRAALTRLPEVFGRVQPETVRELGPEEVQALDDEKAVLDEIVKALTAREKAIGTVIRHHMAETARRRGLVTEATEVDARGFPILAAPQAPQRHNVPGRDRAWSLEFRSGSVGIDAAKLLRLYEDGEISRTDYLAFTREVRVFDEAKALRAVAKQPRLMRLLRQITVRGRSSTSLFVRKPE